MFYNNNETFIVFYIPMATAVSWASPVTNFTLTPQLYNCSIDSRTNGFGGSQIPTNPKYTKSCREFPLANAITIQNYINVLFVKYF